MLNESINWELIKAIKEKTANSNTANVLSDILILNSEAIYRRLRGQVPFTLDEAIRICKELNISLDLLVGIKNEKKFAFHFDTFLTDNPLQEYIDMLMRITQSMEPLKGDPSARLYEAHRTIPHNFFYNYRTVSKVYVYIMYYQLRSHNAEIKKMSELSLPDNLHKIQKDSASCVHSFDSLLILDKNIIMDFISIVKFFVDLKMILAEEVDQIKKELHLLINDMEKCTDTGKSLKGAKMDIYLSHISFDCNYNCIESDHFSVSSVGTYCLNYLSCENPAVFKVHKAWIMSLRKFSVLISVADELTRKKFFNEQRNHVDTLM